jgi:hypothetical protein
MRKAIYKKCGISGKSDSTGRRKGKNTIYFSKDSE